MSGFGKEGVCCFVVRFLIRFLGDWGRWAQGIIMIIVCVPQLNRQIASISARWENEDEEVKATSTVAAPQVGSGWSIPPIIEYQPPSLPPPLR